MSEVEIIGSPVEDELSSSPSMDDESPFQTMMASFDEAARLLETDRDEYQILRKPDRQIAVSIPVRLDDGTLTVFDGYRVQHNAGLGPFLGPLRLDKNLKIDELRALAAWMTWKCALLNVPFGGASGGINMDPKSHSLGEIERAVRRYTANFLGDIGPERDVLCPDLASDENIMAWVMDTISSHARHTENSAVTGKPLELGGSIGHLDAVAMGLSVILRLAVPHFGLARGPLDVVVQGAGTVGGNLVRILHAEEHRIVGFSDVHGGLYNPRGLDIPKLLEWRNQHGSLRDVAGDFEQLPREKFMALPCDVLFPCAIPNAINSRNARNVRTRLVIEGAHGPVSARADKILDEAGIPVVPDILANGGGTVLSYFEWVQNRQGFYWIEPVIQQRLRRFMREAWFATCRVKERYNVRMRMAANILAVERVANADEARGLYA